MNIGGFLPFSLCDYPGLPAAVVFTQGCNFRCPYCHNGDLIPERAGRLDPSDTLGRLRNRKDTLGGIVISGGEPTVHGDLGAFCAEVASIGLRLKLDTNGSRPDELRALLDARLLDYVAMDVKAPLSKYALLSGVPVDVDAIAESIRLLWASGIRHEFRTTVVPGLLAENDIEEIKRFLPRGARHVTQRARPLPPPWSGRPHAVAPRHAIRADSAEIP